jgi:hypothetical protein
VQKLAWFFSQAVHQYLMFIGYFLPLKYLLLQAMWIPKKRNLLILPSVLHKKWSFNSVYGDKTWLGDDAIIAFSRSYKMFTETI